MNSCSLSWIITIRKYTVHLCRPFNHIFSDNSEGFFEKTIEVFCEVFVHIFFNETSEDPCAVGKEYRFYKFPSNYYQTCQVYLLRIFKRELFYTRKMNPRYIKGCSKK